MSKERKIDIPESFRRQLVNYGPATLLGSGGEHVVFRIDKPSATTFPDGRVVRDNNPFVLKVSTLGIHTFNDRLTPMSSHDYLVDRSRNLEAEASDRQRRLKKLREYFGDNHVLPESSWTKMLFLTTEEYQQLFPNRKIDHHAGYYIIDTFIRMQDVVAELDPNTPDDQKRKTASLVLPYAELGEIDGRDYTDTNIRWVMLQNMDRPFGGTEEGLIKRVQNSSSLDAMLQAARGHGDSQLHAALSEFVPDCIAYSNDTREILDLSGENNILFLGNGVWDYKLIDALYPRNVGVIDMTINALQGITLGALAPQEKIDLLNGLGYIRSINALAEALGLRERIRLFNQPDALPSWVWGKVLREFHKS